MSAAQPTTPPPCDWEIGTGWGATWTTRRCGRIDAHDHDSIGGTKHRRGFREFATEADEEIGRESNLHPIAAPTTPVPLRRLDIGFFPGAVFLLEGATPADVERIKATLRDVAEGETLAFRDSDFLLSDSQEGICGYPDGTAYCVILTRPGLEGAARVKVLAHEAFHATACVLRQSGIRLSVSSEEVYAYLLEHLLSQALEPEAE